MSGEGIQIQKPLLCASELALLSASELAVVVIRAAAGSTARRDMSVAERTLTVVNASTCTARRPMTTKRTLLVPASSSASAVGSAAKPAVVTTCPCAGESTVTQLALDLFSRSAGNACSGADKCDGNESFGDHA